MPELCGNDNDDLCRGTWFVGALGISDPHIVGEFQRKMKENHNGMINCFDLLKANAQAGGQKKPHCDGMIKEAIELIEEYR